MIVLFSNKTHISPSLLKLEKPFKTAMAPRLDLFHRIDELARRATNKAIERTAISKAWVMESLRENAEK
jgi:hypothetical protein